MRARRAVVIGAGMAGLSAARRLLRAAGPHLDVRLLEASPRPDGLVRSTVRDGFLLEWGPDSILVEGPAPWVDALGLRHDLIEGRVPARTFVVRRGALHPLPEHLMRLTAGPSMAMLASPLLSARGKLDLALEPLRPRGGVAAGDVPDESIGDFVHRRMGPDFARAVADPLLRGVYGAPISDLSLAACMPGMVRIEREHGAVGRYALSRLLWPEDAPQKRLLSLRRGMGSLIDALASGLEPALTTGAPVRALETRTGGGLRVRLRSGDPIDADVVILATPAHVAAPLLAPLHSPLAAELAAIEHGSLLAVHAAWPPGAVPELPAGTGFVVPIEEGRSMRACTFASEKWPGRAPRGHTLLRAFMILDEPDDDRVVAAALADLEDLLGITAAPTFTEVQRVARALPRYHVGHAGRVRRIRAHVSDIDGLFLAGNAYGGVGLTACMQSGDAAADRALAQLAGHGT